MSSALPGCLQAAAEATGEAEGGAGSEHGQGAGDIGRGRDERRALGKRVDKPIENNRIPSILDNRIIIDNSYRCKIASKYLGRNIGPVLGIKSAHNVAIRQILYNCCVAAIAKFITIKANIFEDIPQRRIGYFKSVLEYASRR